MPARPRYFLFRRECRLSLHVSDGLLLGSAQVGRLRIDHHLLDRARVGIRRRIGLAYGRAYVFANVEGFVRRKATP